MTRAPGPGTEIDYRSVGRPGAARVILVLRSGPLATSDPDPEVTAQRDVRLLLVGLDGEELSDPPTFGGETPAGSTAAQVLALLDTEAPGPALGLVAERTAVPFAITLAADLGARIDRLALVAPAPPETPLAADLLTARLERIGADTVVLAGPDDAAAARSYAGAMPAAATWIREADAGGRIALSRVWRDVLDHVAPHG